MLLQLDFKMCFFSHELGEDSSPNCGELQCLSFSLRPKLSTQSLFEPQIKAPSVSNESVFTHSEMRFLYCCHKDSGSLLFFHLLYPLQLIFSLICYFPQLLRLLLLRYFHRLGNATDECQGK